MNLQVGVSPKGTAPVPARDSKGTRTNSADADLDNKKGSTNKDGAKKTDKEIFVSKSSPKLLGDSKKSNVSEEVNNEWRNASSTSPNDPLAKYYSQIPEKIADKLKLLGEGNSLEENNKLVDEIKELTNTELDKLDLSDRDKGDRKTFIYTLMMKKSLEVEQELELNEDGPSLKRLFREIELQNESALADQRYWQAILSMMGIYLESEEAASFDFAESIINTNKHRYAKARQKAMLIKEENKKLLNKSSAWQRIGLHARMVNFDIDQKISDLSNYIKKQDAKSVESKALKSKKD